MSERSETRAANREELDGLCDAVGLKYADGALYGVDGKTLWRYDGEVWRPMEDPPRVLKPAEAVLFLRGFIAGREVVE